MKFIFYNFLKQNFKDFKKVYKTLTIIKVATPLLTHPLMIYEQTVSQLR